MVCGGPYDSDILKLENIHLDATLLVTGVIARSNIINAHIEFGGYSVSDRIKHATLTVLFKVVRGKALQ